MIRDLKVQGQVHVDTDFLVIGGGTVGLFISVWLAEAGHTVTCLESGAMHQNAETHPFNDVVQLKSVYDGAARGRFRCLGGTSTRWGGALIPFQEADFCPAFWPLGMADVAPYVRFVEAEFGLGHGDYDLPEFSSSTHKARLAKWPPFRKRNVFYLLERRMARLDNLSVWLNATAADFFVDRGELRKVVARTPAGGTMSVTANRVILAAGAIETTRLTLMLDAQNGGIVSKTSPVLGRYFSDHLSVNVGEMVPHDTSELNRHVGFRFENGGTMRNLRFELSDDVSVRSKSPACFAHIAFESENRGGFEILRDMLRATQKRQLPSLQDMIGLSSSLPWLVRAIWSRFVRKRALFPDRARFSLHMVIDQQPDDENHMRLSNSAYDVFGKPLAQIAWTVTEKDKENLAKAVDAFEAMWPTLSIGKNTRLIRRPAGEVEAELVKGGGIYHPTGSTRMATTPDQGVVDRNLCLFSVPNVALLSTASFPTGGGANPTMTLLLLAARYVALQGGCQARAGSAL